MPSTTSDKGAGDTDLTGASILIRVRIVDSGISALWRSRGLQPPGGAKLLYHREGCAAILRLAAAGRQSRALSPFMRDRRPHRDLPECGNKARFGSAKC